MRSRLITTSTCHYSHQSLYNYVSVSRRKGDEWACLTLTDLHYLSSFSTGRSTEPKFTKSTACLGSNQ